MRILRFIIITLLVIVAVASLWAFASGNEHLFFGVRHTYLKGRGGPCIDECEIYSNREVKAGDHVPWPIATSSNSLSSEDLQYHEDMRTAGFLVIQSDTVRYEYYDEEHGPEVPTNIWSMAKSIMSVLIGIAEDEGLLSEEDLLETYFSKYQGSGIRIRHLLTMSSGINFDESYADPFGHQAKALYGNDLVALNEDYDPVIPPGELLEYRGGNTILLGMVLRKVSGMELSDYASAKLWSRMGVENNALWSMDREGGIEKVFCCFHITPCDMARFGQLILHGGVWEGDTIVSQRYIQKATSAANDLSDNGTHNQRYGYHWWVLDLPEYQGYYARGLDGQFMVILPEEELIMVRTGDKESDGRNKGHVADMLRYIDMSRAVISGK